MRNRFGAVLNVVSSTRKLKLLAATIGSVLLATAGAANATTVAVTIDYTVSYSATHGNGPGITEDIGTLSSGQYTFTETLTVGAAETAPVNFLTLSPNGYCGSGCVNNTASGNLTATFSVNGVAGSVAETGLYQAKYSGSELSCSTSGSGESDCINWTTNGSGGHNPLVFTLSNGDTLDIYLNDAQDWNLYPQIAFSLTAPSQTPLPGALPLFASGCGVLGIFEWRRKKRIGKNRKASA